MTEKEYLINNLYNKLKDDYDLSYKKIIEIVNCYDNIYAFMSEQNLIYDGEYINRYHFLYCSELDETDTINLEIIKSLIKLQSFNSLYYLDYIMILYKISNISNSYTLKTSSSKLYFLLSTYLVNLYDNCDDIIERYIDDYQNALTCIINNNYQDILDSYYISNNEKEIIKKYNLLYKKFSNVIFQNEYYRYSIFDSVLDVSFAYFVCSNKINKEYYKIMAFLDNLNDNFMDIIIKLDIQDIFINTEILKLIKDIYEGDKLIIKKQIK